VNTYYWAATTNLYEFAVNDVSNRGVKGPPNPGPLTHLTLWVDGQPAGSTLAGRTVPVKLATGAHLLRFRFAVTNISFCPAMFVRDVNESGFVASYNPSAVNSGGLYLLLPKRSLFTETHATPPKITTGPATTSHTNSNTVTLAVTAATANPGPLTCTWSKVAGPVEGSATFSPNRTTGASNTVATFGLAGAYLLQVVVNDGTAVTFGQLPVTVGNAKQALVVTPDYVNLRTNMMLSHQTPPSPLSRADKPRVTIRKLVAPLPIDGDLEKWRKIGLTPQIVLTPALDSPITGAKDCSGVIRLAYEGDNIYVQLLRFDDEIVFDPAMDTNLQDSLEMMINGFMKPGFQFIAGKFGAGGTDALWRRRFHGELSKLPPDAVPRVVRVLDNATAVPERKMVEDATGEDLSQAKVIVMEFKLPITKTGAYAGEGEGDLFPVEAGKGFWLGFNVNDNDTPGLNDDDTPGTGMGVVQKSIGWPASFGTFRPKENGVWAVFE